MHGPTNVEHMSHCNTKSRPSLLHHITAQLKVVVQAMGGAISTG